MQYFKHQSNMRNDIKIKRVISKYGLEGYGLYNLILESITESLSTDSPLPDLHENCEDIAEFYNGNTAKINEMMSYMINQGLFDVDEVSGRVLCAKLYKFLDTSQTRSVQLREMIRNYKKASNLLIETTYDVSETVSDSPILAVTNLIELEEEENKKKNIEEKKTQFKKPTIEEIEEYCKERNNNINAESFYHHYEANGWMRGKTKIKAWKSCIITWEKNQKDTTSLPKKESDTYNVATIENCKKCGAELKQGVCVECDLSNVKRETQPVWMQQ